MLFFTLGFCAQAQDGAYIQDPLADGVIVIEAEHYANRVNRGSTSWNEVTLSGGEVALKAEPDTGVKIDVDFASLSSYLEYPILFDRAGTHYIVVRGYGEVSTADTVHAGLNGMANGTSDRIVVGDRSLSWSNETLDDTVASFEVPSAGLHTLTIWLREDGFILDRILLSTQPGFLPLGEGPPENLRVGDIGETELDVRASVLEPVVGGENMLLMPFQPVPGVEEYALWMKPSLHAPFSLASNAVAEGFTWMADVSEIDRGYFRMESIPVSSDDQLSGLLLQRAAYGPTPDLLAQVKADPEAYLDQALSPDTMVDAADSLSAILDIEAALDSQSATLDDLQAWHSLRAVHSDRQLQEVLLQFFSNHFSDDVDTVRNWLDDEGGQSGSLASRLSVNMEYRELEKWRSILLDPAGSFYDLLKVSAESPAMIIYLDTIENEAGSPNENYARELLELYTMGVDNGYTQKDIEEMSRVWTGWRIGLAHPADTNVPPQAYNQAVVVDFDAAGWLYRKGTSEPPSDWHEETYVPDTNWISGQAPIGYGDDGETTVIADMQNNYPSLYFRHTFMATNVASVEALSVRVNIDDGCIAYINGAEIGRVRAGDFGDVYLHDQLCDDLVTNPELSTFLVSNASSILVEGENVLAIHGMNGVLHSRDFGMDAQIVVGPPPVYVVDFDVGQHDVSNKVIFAGQTMDPRFGPPWSGQSYEIDLPARSGLAGMQDGYDVLEQLANLPYTMEYICVKLCQVLVHEDFQIGDYYNISQRSAEADLIHACMLAWENPVGGNRKGNIRQVVRTILTSDLFRSQAAARQKVKTPFEMAVSSIRALRGSLSGGGFAASTDGYDLQSGMDRAGMELFSRGSPDGWPEEGSRWIDTQTLAERLRFVQNLLAETGSPLKEAEFGADGSDNLCDPSALLLEHVSAVDQQQAERVTDYFIGLLFPGVGAANLDLERNECLRLLNSDDGGGVDSSPFSALSPGSQVYADRVRAMVALLLCSPKFQEQ